MPLAKRIIYSAQSYGHPELHDDEMLEKPQPSQQQLQQQQQAQQRQSVKSTILQDVNMSHLLGAIHQVAYLSSYALEIFDGLVALADDTKERMAEASKRVTALSSSLSRLPRRVQDVEAVHAPGSGAEALAQREIFVPTVLSKATNSSAVKQTYEACSAPPQFWRMDKALRALDPDSAGSSISIFFSNPGFFFQEWYRVEQERQQMLKTGRKREKAERKENKLKRREAKARNDPHWQRYTRQGERRRQSLQRVLMDDGNEPLDDDDFSIGRQSSSTHTPSLRYTPRSSLSPTELSGSPSEPSDSGSYSRGDTGSGSDSNSYSGSESDNSGEDLPAIQEEDEGEPSSSSGRSGSGSYIGSGSGSSGRESYSGSGSGSDNDSVGPPPSESGNAPAGTSTGGSPAVSAARGSMQSRRSAALSSDLGASYEPGTPSDSELPSEEPTPEAPRSSTESPAAAPTAPPALPAPNPNPNAPPALPAPSTAKPSALASIRGIFGSAQPAERQALPRTSARPSVQAFHGAKDAFVPKLLQTSQAQARLSFRPAVLVGGRPSVAPAKPVWGLSAIFKSTAPAAAASAGRKFGSGDSDDDDDDATQTTWGTGDRSADADKRAGAGAARSQPPTSQAGRGRRGTNTRSVFTTRSRSDSHESHSTEQSRQSSVRAQEPQYSKQGSVYAKSALPDKDKDRAGPGYLPTLSSLTSIFRPNRSPQAPAGPAALTVLDEGEDEDGPSSGRQRASSRGSRRGSVESSPPPPDEDDDNEFQRRSARMHGGDDDEPPESDDEPPHEEPAEAKQQPEAKKAPPPPTGPPPRHLRASPPHKPSLVPAVARTSQRPSRKSSPVYNPYLDQSDDDEPAEEHKQQRQPSPRATSNSDSDSDNSDPPVARRPLTWMKAASSFRPDHGRTRGESDLHRQRSGMTHSRPSHLGGAGGRKRGTVLDDEGRPLHSGVRPSALGRPSAAARRSAFDDGIDAQQQQQQHQLHGALHNVPLPPPPPALPPRRRLGSDIANALKNAPSLRKAEAAPAKRVDLRSALMGGIKKGVALKAVEAKLQEPKVVRLAPLLYRTLFSVVTVSSSHLSRTNLPSALAALQQHAAIAQILANRGKIAGDSSDSDDSDSDMSL